MPPADPPEGSVDAANAAGLRWVTDTAPGIRRRRSGKAFTYLDAEGDRVRDTATLDRIRALVIPPAWTDVWICAHPLGHIQATGRDARRRKQYCYHPRWREVRDEAKYHRMAAFGAALPKIRARVAGDLARPGLTRENVLAAAVRVLDTALIRVGNAEYARDNDTYGLTTLLAEHVKISGKRTRITFSGKAGKRHVVDLHDPRIAVILRRCTALPGEELFQYLDSDSDGEPRTLTSDDVNAYLRDIAGGDFTAKDFRTWAGTVLAACSLREQGTPSSKIESRRQVGVAITSVARELGNTPAVCRRCYVHPGVLAAHADGSLMRLRVTATSPGTRRATTGLRPEERAVLRLVDKAGEL